MTNRALMDCPQKSLQWGRGLSTAEILHQFGHSRQGNVASMGPRSLNRGDDRLDRPAGGGALASMGPRSLNRGDIGDEVDSQAVIVASMGPRSLNRGDSRRQRFDGVVALASMGPRSLNRGDPGPAAPAPPFTLGFNGAAVSQPRRLATWTTVAPSHAMLQWGRGLSTAEITF